MVVKGTRNPDAVIVLRDREQTHRSLGPKIKQWFKRANS